MTEPRRQARDIKPAPSRVRDVSQSGHPALRTTLAIVSAAAIALSGVGYFAVGRLGGQLSASDLKVSSQSKGKDGNALDGAMEFL